MIITARAVNDFLECEVHRLVFTRAAFDDEAKASFLSGPIEREYPFYGVSNVVPITEWAIVNRIVNEILAVKMRLILHFFYP